MNKQELVHGLREILAAIEKPEFPEDGNFTLSWAGVRVAYSSAENFGRAAVAMGGFEKGASDLFLTAIRHIGQIDFEVYIERTVTCKKIVKGTRVVPAKEREVRTYITAAVPERVEEIVEWQCPESFAALANSGEESQVPAGISADADVARTATDEHKPYIPDAVLDSNAVLGDEADEAGAVRATPASSGIPDEEIPL